MKDSVLKVWAKNMGAYYPQQRIIHGKKRKCGFDSLYFQFTVDIFRCHPIISQGASVLP